MTQYFDPPDKTQSTSTPLTQTIPAKKKAGHFQICAEMAKRGLDIRMSLLENVTNVQYQKRTKGTLVTIGVDGNVVGDIGIGNRFVGGLLLCDRKQYFEIADELNAAESAATRTLEFFAAHTEEKGE